MTNPEYSGEADTQENGGAYEMEKRLIALKNVYAENGEQKRDQRYSYASYTMAFVMSDRKKITVSAEERYHMIAKEAYLRAKRQGFESRVLLECWAAAEAEIDRMLKGNEPEPVAPRDSAVLRGHE